MSRMSFAKRLALVLFLGFFWLQFSSLAQTVSSPDRRLLLTIEAAPNLPSGNYLATIYADADDADKSPPNVRSEKKTVTRSSRLQAKVAASPCDLRQDHSSPRPTGTTGPTARSSRHQSVWFRRL